MLILVHMIFLHRSWLIVVASSVKFTEYWLEAKDSYRLVVDSYDFNRKISRIMRPLAQSFCTKLGSTVSLSRANSVRLHSLALGPGHDMRKPIHLLSHPGNISLVFLCFPHKILSGCDKKSVSLTCSLFDNSIRGSTKQMRKI